MSQPRVIGSVATAGATAATLPVTGQPVATMVFAGVAFIVGGLLLIRSSRLSHDAD
ncbi:MAG: LPXTG cell wall anchor domain-containing protein [Micromonosporaceae bacterium]|nr:LPXTG cell wall anchor domain-containing protein [Micromonosporaceae bacterium]